MLPVVTSVLPYHVSDISVLSKYYALEATPTSTSPPRVNSDLAAKFNFTDNEESGSPNLTSKSEAADADLLDFDHDRMASWRAHANLLMLFSGLLSALVATQLLQACWAARPVLPGTWVVCLARVFQLMGNAAAGAPGTLSPSPSPPPPLSTSRSLGVSEVVLPLALPALTRALWLTSLVVGLGCTMAASLLKERACRDWRITRSWRYHQHERKAEYSAFFFGDGGEVRPMVDMTRFFLTIHAFHLVSVALYLWGLGIPLVRSSGPLALMVVGVSGATFFIGQCLIISALPR